MPTFHSQAHWLAAQKSHRTTKTSQRVCLPNARLKAKQLLINNNNDEKSQHQAVTTSHNTYS